MATQSLKRKNPRSHQCMSQARRRQRKNQCQRVNLKVDIQVFMHELSVRSIKKVKRIVSWPLLFQSSQVFMKKKIQKFLFQGILWVIQKKLLRIFHWKRNIWKNLKRRRKKRKKKSKLRKRSNRKKMLMNKGKRSLMDKIQRLIKILMPWF